MKLENLMINKLAGAVGTEVVMSHIALPANVTLPTHWHPGEEFAYVLEGSLTLIQEGEADQLFEKGDYGVVPYKKVHTITTGDNGVVALIFRVHEEGQPERVLAEA